MSDLDSDPQSAAGSAFDRLEALDQGAPELPTNGAADVEDPTNGATTRSVPTDSNAPTTTNVPNVPNAPNTPAHMVAAPAVAAGNGSGPRHSVGDAPKLTRRGRLRKWDRPKQPMDWRFWVGSLGKTLISVGILMFAFVAYQLWGTGIETARAQNQLENEFDALLAEVPEVTLPEATDSGVFVDVPVVIDDGAVVAEPGQEDTTSTVAPAEPAVVAEPVEAVPEAPAATLPVVPVEAQNIPEIQNGQAIARIEIPAIGVSDIVVAGVRTGDLKKGPGHFPDTPLPGQLGNSAIAGHRTTYGAPFGNVDKLKVGDTINVTTLSGRFTYRITGQQIVSPSDYWVVATTDPTRATLTLTSCHPKWTAQQRIVIFSELVPEESGPVGEAVLNYGQPAEDVAAPPSELPSEDVGDETVAVIAADGDVSPDDSGGFEATAPPAGGAEVSGNLVDDQSAVADDTDADALATANANDGIADAFSETWFSDPGANLQVGLWGMMLALVGILAYAISRKLRRDWAGALVGMVPFMVTLYFFFQNVNRLLPPNL